MNSFFYVCGVGDLLSEPDDEGLKLNIGGDVFVLLINGII